MYQRVATLCALSLLFLAFSNIPQKTEAVSSTVVISEFRTRGPNGGNDEFIELYNLSSSPVNISGWQIRGSNESGTITTRAVITGGVTLNPGCHYLLTNPNSTGGPYSGSLPGNQTFGPGITDDGGIALTDAAGIIIDQVGMSAGSAFREGLALTPRTSNVNSSYERRPGGAAGNGQDTDNNAADFSFVSSNPQNANSTCLSSSGPTDPQAIILATPVLVVAGNTTLLVVTVTPGTNPTSNGINVTGNLTSIGGNSSQQFFDDGTNGDQVAGDNRFSYLATVAADTPAGAKFLFTSVADGQGRMAAASAILTVVTADSPQCGVERWAVKTGTDQDAELVDLESLETATTISIMRNWAAPNPIPESRRVPPHETTVYAIAGTLTLYKLDDDTDYHAVIQDAGGNTIIVKIVCACCVADISPFKSLITPTRQKFDERLTVTGNFQTANLPVFIRGVGFFGSSRDAAGAAPNGIELHPVLDIRFLLSPREPVITDAEVSGKKLLVSGVNFDSDNELFVDGAKQKTTLDAASGGLVLIAKKAGKKIPRGSTVELRLRYGDGVSGGVLFTRPN